MLNGEARNIMFSEDLHMFTMLLMRNEAEQGQDDSHILASDVQVIGALASVALPLINGIQW